MNTQVRELTVDELASVSGGGGIFDELNPVKMLWTWLAEQVVGTTIEFLWENVVMAEYPNVAIALSPDIDPGQGGQSQQIQDALVMGSSGGGFGNGNFTYTITYSLGGSGELREGTVTVEELN